MELHIAAAKGTPDGKQGIAEVRPGRTVPVARIQHFDRCAIQEGEVFWARGTLPECLEAQLGGGLRFRKQMGAAQKCRVGLGTFDEGGEMPALLIGLACLAVHRILRSVFVRLVHSLQRGGRGLGGQFRKRALFRRVDVVGGAQAA